MNATLPQPRLRALSAIFVTALCVCTLSCIGDRADSWRVVAARIESTSDPDSTAVLVALDPDLLAQVRSRLTKKIAVFAYQVPDTLRYDADTRSQLRQIYRAASEATEGCTEVWVVGMRPDSPGRKRAALSARGVASMLRRLVLRDSLVTSHGTIVFSRWVDQPAGVARRAENARAMVWADSVIAAGPPKRTPITVPFSRSDLSVDPDTLAFFMAKLPDTSFYHLSGDELVMWDASERLGRLGPGIVPALIARIDDPDPFVRERVEEALSSATQDERILARTDGQYLRFYDNPASPDEVVRAWWAKFGRFWASADRSLPGKR